MAGDRFEDAGEADGLSNVITPPLVGSLITIPALCRCGILKSVLLAGAGLGAWRFKDGAGCMMVGGGGPGVCDFPRLEVGRSVAEIADELRDICCVWGGLLY